MENLIEIRNRNYSEEKILNPFNGWIFLLINFLVLIISIAILWVITKTTEALLSIGGVILIFSFFLSFGLFTNEPNVAIVVLFYGKYQGTIKSNGFFWINPFTNFTRISLRSKNMDGAVTKVNDKDGSPIEIAIVVVWKVENTAQAVFDVENYDNYLKIQSESAIRHIASSYPYDKHDENEPSLRGLHPEIIDHLIVEMQKKARDAGIKIIDAKITHLAYSPEVSNAMLRRQQAQAVIEARQKIIQGPVEIVNDAVSSFENMDFKMNDNQKSNLTTNLCCPKI